MGALPQVVAHLDAFVTGCCGRVMVNILESPTNEDSGAAGPVHKASLRTARLRRSSRFREIRSSGRWLSHRLLVLGLLANGLDSSRCGFSASKRLGNAVVRNRARRRMREAVRGYWPAVASGWDVVFAAREPLRDAAFADIEQAVSTLLQRAHLLQSIT